MVTSGASSDLQAVIEWTDYAPSLSDTQALGGSPAKPFIKRKARAVITATKQDSTKATTNTQESQTKLLYDSKPFSLKKELRSLILRIVIGIFLFMVGCIAIRHL